MKYAPQNYKVIAGKLSGTELAIGNLMPYKKGNYFPCRDLRNTDLCIESQSLFFYYIITISAPVIIC